MHRRAFLRTSVLAGSAAVVGCRTEAPGNHSAAAPPHPRIPGVWEKHGIVLEATAPREGDHVQNFTNRAEPLSGGAWRLWYSVSDQRKGYKIDHGNQHAEP